MEVMCVRFDSGPQSGGLAGRHPDHCRKDNIVEEEDTRQATRYKNNLMYCTAGRKDLRCEMTAQ